MWGCGKAMFKWFLVFFNVIFVILGAVCLAVGLWVKFDNDSVLSALQRMPENAQEATTNFDIAGLLSSAAILLIIVGASIFAIGFFGCCGAWKELRLFLIIYAVILGAVFILEVAGVICWIFFREKVDEYLVPFLTEQLETGYETGVRYEDGVLTIGSDAATMAWDAIQITLECCAVTGYEGYQNATAWDNTYVYEGQTIEAVVPISCCKIINPRSFPDDIESVEFQDLEGCLLHPDSNNANLEGCYYSILDILDEYSYYCIWILVGVILAEVMSIVFAFCLYGTIKKDEYKEV